MLVQVLTAMSDGLNASAGWAALAACLWGMASFVLSPCHLTGVPLLVAFINGGPPTSGGRAATVATWFGVGLLIAIAVAGGAAVLIGRLAGDLGPWMTYGVVAILLIAGLALLDLIPLHWPLPDVTPWKGRGVVAALVLGGVFGLALGPCTFAFLAPVLAVGFRSGQHDTGTGLLLVVAFAIGHCAVLVAIGASAGQLQRRLTRHDGRGPHILRAASGVLVIVGALYLLYQA